MFGIGLRDQHLVPSLIRRWMLAVKVLATCTRSIGWFSEGQMENL